MKITEIKSMKVPLSDQEIEFLIQTFQKREPIPLEFKYKLFPTEHKEYELNYAGKMRPQDILRGDDGVFPVPLQIEKVFNGSRQGFKDGWKNIIVFGDNLQFLKTCYHNADELVVGRIKGKVKLIYIDPPFGTGDEYEGNSGQRGYTAKRKNADFVEFIRRRLIVAKEVLADDGIICVRQAHQFGHYIKIVMDEVFGKSLFQNELVVNRIKKNVTKKGRRTIPHAVDNIYVYFKSDQSKFHHILKKLEKQKKGYWHSMDSAGVSGPRQAVIDGVTYFPPKGTHFKFTQKEVDRRVEEKTIRVNPKTKKPQYWVEPKTELTLDTNWTDIPGYTFKHNYPTENSEKLLERIILLGSEEGDLVMDFFAGSGTTAAVAEKLGRRWIVCDIGKLSFYTIQKRMLTIQESNDLFEPSEKYGKEAKAFITLNVGQYDLAKLVDLGKEKYSNFVLNLFEVEAYVKPKKIKGYEICGERNGSYCLIWEFWKYKSEANVDAEFIEELHENLKGRIGNRFYIIAPANAVDFISDYYEIDDMRYYFLKVPYQIIQELHKEQFKKFRQPQTKTKINDIDDAVGFHFTRQPEVKSTLSGKKLVISEFRSCYTEEGTDREMENFESLSMVLVDRDFNGKEFAMDEYHFAADLLSLKTEAASEDEESEPGEEIEEEIQSELKQRKTLSISLKNCGSVICIKYIDIYGNEFTETLQMD
jgi:adenine-specific DNA-methyltransferase